MNAAFGLGAEAVLMGICGLSAAEVKSNKQIFSETFAEFGKVTGQLANLDV